LQREAVHGFGVGPFQGVDVRQLLRRRVEVDPDLASDRVRPGTRVGVVGMKTVAEGIRRGRFNSTTEASLRKPCPTPPRQPRSSPLKS